MDISGRWHKVLGQLGFDSLTVHGGGVAKLRMIRKVVKRPFTLGRRQTRMRAAGCE